MDLDLPNNLLLYILLVVTLAVGYLLGKRENKPSKTQATVIKDYYQGLNFLLGDRPELGVDRFIQAMEVSDDSVDVHLALASVVRRRGELDKAIRIHQNLLASPRLSSANKQLVEFELARDYHAAGLLDRAEGLLTDIVRRRDVQAQPARLLLIDLYEQERDWHNALSVAQGGGSDRALKQRMSHFWCELAEQSLAADKLQEARERVRAAIGVDTTNPRGHWLKARYELQANRPKRVLSELQKVVDLAPDMAVEVMELYRQACERLGAETDYVGFLRNCAQHFPDVHIIRALASSSVVVGRRTPREELLSLIEQNPDPAHVPLLMEWLDPGNSQRGKQVSDDHAGQDGSNANGKNAPQSVDEAQRMQDLIATIGEESRDYQCANCGFQFHQHIWHCPTCKAWGEFTRHTG